MEEAIMTHLYMVELPAKTIIVELASGLDRQQAIETILEQHPEATKARGISYRESDGATLYDGPWWHLKQ